MYKVFKVIDMSHSSTFHILSGAGNSFLVTNKKYLSDFFNYLEDNSTAKDVFSKKEQKLISEGFFQNFTNDIKNKVNPLCEVFEVDGFCLLEIDKNHQVEWVFFNRDGSQAYMCGNATCCITEYLYQENLIPSSLSKIIIKIGNTSLEAGLDDRSKAQVRFPLPRIESLKTSIILNDQKQITFSQIDSGVRHIIIECEELYNSDLFQKNQVQHLRNLAKELRAKYPDFNITFYCKDTSSNDVRAVTFERGVEDFTLACGTGALAVSYLLNHQSMEEGSRQMIHMLGGSLEVDFNGNQAYLKSPVQNIDALFTYH